MKYKITKKKKKTILGMKQIYLGKRKTQHIKVMGKYYPLYPKRRRKWLSLWWSGLQYPKVILM